MQITFNANSDLKNPKYSGKERYLSNLKQGVLVNNFIHDNTSNNIMFNEKSGLPEDLYAKKHNKKDSEVKTLLPLMVASTVVLGIGVVLSAIYKKSIPSKLKLKEKQAKDLLPPVGRIITLNDDNIASLYFLTQDPNRKTFLGAAGVLVASGATFIMKNVVDGFKEVWVKKKEAEVMRNQEEALINIETRSFEGKNKILSFLMNKTNKELKSNDKNISFKGYNENLFKKFNKNVSFKENSKKDTKTLIPFLAAGTVVLAGVLTGAIFKNIKSIARNVEKSNKTILDNLSKNITEMSVKKLKDDLFKLNSIDENANKLLKSLIESKTVSKEHKTVIKEFVNDSTLAVSPEHLGGWANKFSFTSFVGDITSFLYLHIVNKTPQTKNLFLLTSSVAAGSYVGTKAVEAVKEVEVKKENSKTEIDLQDKLVEVELKNFMSKKEAFIKPLKENYKFFLSQNLDDSAKKVMQQSILDEVKNGPPFIYS